MVAEFILQQADDSNDTGKQSRQKAKIDTDPARHMRSETLSLPPKKLVEPDAEKFFNAAAEFEKNIVKAKPRLVQKVVGVPVEFDAPNTADPLADVSALRNMVRFIEKNYKQLDTDHDGSLGWHEVESTGSTLFKPGTKEDKMLRYINDSNLVFDLGSHSKGFLSELALTRKGLNDYSEKISSYEAFRKDQQDLTPDAYRIATFGELNFGKLDSDKNGYLTRSELKSARAAAGVSEEDKHSIDLVTSNYKEISQDRLQTRYTRMYRAVFPAEIKKADLRSYLDFQHVQAVRESRGYVAALKLVAAPTSLYYTNRDVTEAIDGK